MFHEYKKDNFTISTNPDLLDIDMIHSFLTNSYWAPRIPREVVVKSIKNSLCFGLYNGEKQVGFAGVVTDYTHFAYVQDVFVVEEYRGRGLGKWLLESVVSCPNLHGIRRILLATKDAHSVYAKCGFGNISDPDKWMEILFDRPWFKST